MQPKKAICLSFNLWAKMQKVSERGFWVPTIARESRRSEWKELYRVSRIHDVL